MTNKTTPDRYALVGHPVEHSRSPLIHTVFARQTGQRLTYELIDAEPPAFETAVRGFGAAGGKGMNVTVPHKEAAFALCRQSSEAATAAGAVNTISITDGALTGHNTDGIGFIRDLTVNLRQSLAGARVVVLGAGGAARAVIDALARDGACDIAVVNRSADRAAAAAALGGDAGRVGSVDDVLAATLLVNATSVGMGTDELPLDAALLHDRLVVADLVYHPLETALLRAARTRGATAVDGLGMLVHQAARSFRLWTGVDPPTDVMRAAAMAELSTRGVA